MRPYFASAVVVSMLLAVPVRADEAADLKDIWKPTEGTHAGTALPKDFLDSITLTITEGMYQVKVMGIDEKGTFKFDAAKTPKTMDITPTDGPNKGKSILAIYDLTGDTLKICYDVEGILRPTKFESTKENQALLLVYKRKK